jgi:hypothetical protein
VDSPPPGSVRRLMELTEQLIVLEEGFEPLIGRQTTLGFQQ